MKTNTMLVIIMVVLVGLFLVFSNDDNQIERTQSASILVADKELHDFGEIDIFSGKVATEFLLTNNGPDAITIIAGTTSCACTDAEIGGLDFGMHKQMANEFIIPARATENLKVIYDPLAHGPSGTGLIQRSVFLKTNSNTNPELEVRIRAIVTKSE